MKKSIEIIVEGRVQGVGFRAFTLSQAFLFEINGYVENLSNGQVKIIANGEEDKLKKFIEKMRKGPLYSTTKNLKIYDITIPEQFDDFNIKY